MRGTTLAARGWTQEGGELFEVLARLDRDGCARYVVTDVGRDGTMTGPNLDLLRDVCAATDRPVVASGGVSSLADLRAIATLVPLGVEGAIVGKALYAGAFTLRGCVGGGVAMTARRKVSSGAPWEAVVGYSRAVAAGDNIWVTGCTSIVDGEVVHDGDPYEQTAQAIRNVAWALDQLGSSLEDVVRTRIFVTDISRWEEYGRAHGEAFGEVHAGDLDGPGVGADRPADDGRGRGGRLQAGLRMVSGSPSGSSRAWTSTPAGSSRASTSPTCATRATRSRWPQVYDAEGADELTFLDITASSGARETTYDVVRRTAEQVFIPLTVGGGVRTAEDVDRLLRAGADKVGVNTAAIARPDADRARSRGGSARRCWCCRSTRGAAPDAAERASR